MVTVKCDDIQKHCPDVTDRVPQGRCPYDPTDLLLRQELRKCAIGCASKQNNK